MLRKYIYILILLFGSVFLALPRAFAEDSSNETTDEEVVVTASRTEQTLSQSPGYTEVITGEEIKESGKTTVAEVVSDQAIPVATNGGVSGVAMVQLDGSSAEQTLVLVNGIAANTGCAGSVDLSCFPVAGIQRVETVHGPLSSLYGANALGGVVNIITDLTGGPQNEALFSGASFNTRNLGLNVQQNKWGIACGANFSDGFRERSQSDGNFLMAQYNFHDGQDDYLKLYFQAMNRTTQVPGPISWPSTDAQQTDHNFSVNLNGKNSLLQGLWEYKVYAQYLDVQYTEYSIPDRHQTWNGGFDCAGLYTAGNHELLVGLALKHQFSDSSIDQQHTQDSAGLFLQDSWSITERANLTSGLRYDYYSNFPAPVSPRIHLSYALTPEFTLKGGYGKAFRAPTMNDLYWDQSAYGMTGNPDLKPEQGERYDLTGVWKNGTHSLTVNLFHSNMTDGIRWVNTSGYNYTVDNIAKIKTTGANIQWEKTWNGFFTGKIGYRWLDEKGWNEAAQSFSDDLNVFGNQLDLGFGLRFERVNCRLGWKFAANRNKQMPDYNTGNLRISYKPYKSVTWTFTVDNLTNQNYQVVKDYPMPGMELKLTMNYLF